MTDKQPRTLADMTPEERAQCHGMWCDVVRHDKPAVLHDCFFPSPGRHGAGLYSPSDGLYFYSAAKNVTPRFDLPRAWNADGTPVVADPEEYTADGRSRVYFEGIEKVAFPPGTRVRRWVSDWEAIE